MINVEYRLKYYEAWELWVNSDETLPLIQLISDAQLDAFKQYQMNFGFGIND